MDCVWPPLERFDEVRFDRLAFCNAFIATKGVDAERLTSKGLSLAWSEGPWRWLFRYYEAFVRSSTGSEASLLPLLQATLPATSRSLYESHDRFSHVSVSRNFGFSGDCRHKVSGKQVDIAANFVILERLWKSEKVFFQNRRKSRKNREHYKHLLFATVLSTIYAFWKNKTCFEIRLRVEKSKKM